MDRSRWKAGGRTERRSGSIREEDGLGCVSGALEVGEGLGVGGSWVNSRARMSSDTRGTSTPETKQGRDV